VGYGISDLSSSLAGKRFATICSKNNSDTSPNLVYATGNNILNFTLNWSVANDPLSDIPVPYGANSSSGARFIDSEQALLTNDTANGYTQIFRYDLGTSNLTQLTFDAGDKIDVFIWNAPDYGNLQLLYCTVDDTILPLYEKAGDIFNFVYDIQIPDTSYHYYFSAEPFVFQNNSYLFLCAASEKFIPGLKNNSKPADVWIVALNATQPYFRKVSDSRIALRLDPEVFDTPSEAYIYYYEYYENGNVHPVAMHKCSSGLASVPLSTDDLKNTSLSLKIFPNPANSFIKVSSEKTPDQISINNFMGENILNLIPDKLETAID